MVEPEFRSARPDDTDALIWLESIAREQVAAQRGGELWLERHPAQSPGWQAVGRSEVLVATVDDVVVGYLRFSVDDAVLYVHDVFVHPDAREIGSGDGLLAAAIELGRDRGAHRIEAEALPGDRDTKNLYERAAITAKRITVSASI